MRKNLLFLFALLMSVSYSFAQDYVIDFSSDAVGTTYSKVAWGAGDGNAVVEVNPDGSGGNVLHFTCTNWNCYPMFPNVTLPAGKTVGDINKVTFNIYLVDTKDPNQIQNSWKTINYFIGAPGTYLNPGAPTGSAVNIIQFPADNPFDTWLTKNFSFPDASKPLSTDVSALNQFDLGFGIGISPGDYYLQSITFSFGTPPPPPPAPLLLGGKDFGGSGNNTANPYDPATYTITFNSAWSNRGWWYSNTVGSGADFTGNNEIVINFQPVDFNVQLVIQCNDGTGSSSTASGAGGSVAALLPSGLNDVTQVYIQTSAPGTLTLLSAYADNNAVNVTGVSLSSTTASMLTGTTKWLSATVMPDNATVKDVKWSSDNESVATVAWGTITAVAPGTATITVTTADGAKTDACFVTVTDPILVTGVTLDQKSLDMVVGSTRQLTATVAPNDATNQSLSWSSSNESVATVDGSGLITAVATGTATITVTTADGAKTDACAVTVNPPAPDPLQLLGTAFGGSGYNNGSSYDPSTQTITFPNAWMNRGWWFGSADFSAYNEVVVNFQPVDFQVQLVIQYNDGTQNAASVPAGATSVAALLMGGSNDVKQIYIQTGAAGTLTLVSAAADNNAVFATGVSLNQTSANIYVDGKTWLSATVLNNATNQNVTWSSSNNAIATVDAYGNVTGVSRGTATITAKTEDGGFTADCAVTVLAHVTDVSLDKTVLNMAVGGTLQLTATILPADYADQNVSWKSSNTSVATVGTNGLVTAVAAGTATITVTTNDGGLTATCAVTVTTESVAATGVSLDLATAALVVNNTLQLKATINPAGATNQNLIWSSSDPAVATVSSTGLITAVGAGTATITVTTADGGFTATCTVTVTSTGIPSLNAGTSAYISGDQLVVQSPVAETVQVYSVSGALLDNFQKLAGKVSYPVNESKGTVLIVKGSSGWVKKVIK